MQKTLKLGTVKNFKSDLLKKVQNDFCRGVSIVSHLLFTDNSFLFFKQCRVVKGILQTFEAVLSRILIFPSRVFLFPVII